MMMDLDWFIHIPPLFLLSKKMNLRDGWQGQEMQSLTMETKASCCYSNTKVSPTEELGYQGQSTKIKFHSATS